MILLIGFSNSLMPAGAVLDFGMGPRRNAAKKAQTQPRRKCASILQSADARRRIPDRAARMVVTNASATWRSVSACAPASDDDMICCGDPVVATAWPYADIARQLS